MNIVGIIIDVVIIAILLVFAIIGLKKGFLKSVLSLFSWVVCLLIAIFTAKYVAMWVNSMFDFAGWMGGGIAQGLEGMDAYFKTTIGDYADKAAILAAIPTAINGIIQSITKMALGGVDPTTLDPTTTLSNVVGSSIGFVCLTIICGILIFVILKIVIKLLSKLFDNISRTRVLGGLNRVLGVLLGLVKGAVMVFLINGLLVALSLIPTVNATVTPIIQDHTYVEKFVYNTTDSLVEKYIIEGEVVQNWIEGIWNAR